MRLVLDVSLVDPYGCQYVTFGVEVGGDLADPMTKNYLAGKLYLREEHVLELLKALDTGLNPIEPGRRVIGDGFEVRRR